VATQVGWEWPAVAMQGRLVGSGGPRDAIMLTRVLFCIFFRLQLILVCVPIIKVLFLHFSRPQGGTASLGSQGGTG
jgi:preprotein translocase subunit SecG